MTEASPLPRSSGPLAGCVVVVVVLVVVIPGCEAQPMRTRAKETRMANLSAVDFMRVCLATGVPSGFPS